MNEQLNTTTSSEYSWCIYEIPGHKVGVCRSRNYPNRPKTQLNRLLNKPPYTPLNEGDYKLLEELHDITRSEATDVEQEWQDKLGYVSDRDKASAVRIGKVHSDESKLKMSASRKGMAVSAETKAKLSAANKGKVLSEETKAKLSAAQMGYVPSDETRAKMSIIHKGKVLSEEHKAKLSAANKGKTLSDETKANMSAAQKLRHQKENKEINK